MTTYNWAYLGPAIGLTIIVALGGWTLGTYLAYRSYRNSHQPDKPSYDQGDGIWFFLWAIINAIALVFGIIAALATLYQNGVN